MTFRVGLPLVVGVVALVTMTAWQAHADLADDTAALRQAWSRSGKATAGAPWVATQGDIRPLLLPRAATDPTERECTSVSVLGAPSTTFMLRFASAADGSPPSRSERSEPSSAGAAQLVRCGQRRAMLDRLVVDMRSPRGVLQVVQGRSKEPLPSLRRILPHRDPGPEAPAVVPGPRPAPAPALLRARRLEARDRREGAVEVQQRLVPADRSGEGRIIFRAEPGCHRFALLGVAPQSGNAPGLDLDAELRRKESGELLAVDRTDSPDASLSACVGADEELLLYFTGGVPRIPVLVGHTRWTLPAGLPAVWGPAPRASVAHALRRYGVHNLDDGPIEESLGVVGATAYAAEVEPGACYLAAVAPVRGDMKLLGITATAGGRSAVGHSDEPTAAALLGFCAGASSRVQFDIEARGSGLVWLLALWQTARLPLGTEIR